MTTPISTEVATPPVMDPAAGLPSVPYNFGLSPQNMLAAIDGAGQALRDASLSGALPNTDNGSAQVLRSMGEMVSPQNLGQAAWNAVQNPEAAVQAQLAQRGHAQAPGPQPAQIDDGEGYARQVANIIPSLQALAGIQQAPASEQPAGQVVATQSPAPPPALAPQLGAAPAPSSTDQQLSALTQLVGQLIQSQQAAVAQAQQAQLQAQQAQQQYEAQRWRDPEVAKAALLSRGIAADDPVGLALYRADNENREFRMQMHGQISQLTQGMQQLAGMFSQLQASAQNINSQAETTKQVSALLSARGATQQTITQVASIAHQLLAGGMTPQQAAAAAAAPTLQMLTQARPVTPPPPTQVLANNLHAQAFRGGGVPPGILASPPPNPLQMLQGNLSQIERNMDAIIAQGFAQGR